MQKLLVFLLSWSILMFTSAPVFAANTYPMATTTNWNMRFDGAVAGDGFWKQIVVGDLNNNGKEDLVVAAQNADFNSRSGSGSVYVIFDTSLEQYVGTGNTIDMLSSTSYNIRFDGAGAGDTFGQTALIRDINNDNVNDLLIGARGFDVGGVLSAGAVYIIYGQLIQSYTGTGNNVDMDTSSNFNIRLEGASSDNFATSMGVYDNLDGTNRPALVVAASATDYNGRDAAGSFYVIYNSLLEGYSGTGNIVSMGTSSNYNLRFDGASASDLLGGDGIIFAQPKSPDFDGNGRNELIITSPTVSKVYVVFDGIIDNYSGTGNNIDLATTTNYNIFYTPENVGDTSFGTSLNTSDLDNDGLDDLSIGVTGADFNGRDLSGSVYIIKGNLIDNYSSTTGNNLSMGNTGNFNIRFDGSAIRDGMGGEVLSGYFSNQSTMDLVISAHASTTVNTIGSAFVIYGPIVNSFTGTGNTVDLANSANYSLRYVGTANNQRFSISSAMGDINDDGREDLLFGAGASFNSRATSGSVWVVYNFPHTITATNLSSGVLSGNISVSSNSTTSLSGVQYQVGSDSRSGSWSNCNLSGVNFTCSPSAATSGQTVYVRAFDTNISYTGPGNYGTYKLNVPVDTGSSNPNFKAGWKHPITVGPGRVGGNSNLGTEGFNALISNSVSVIDLYINPTVLKLDNLFSLGIPSPTGNGFTACTDVFNFNALSSFNGYPVFQTLNPYTIILSQNAGASCGAIAYLNQTTNKWTLLSGHFVKNPQNSTIAAVTNQLSYFVGVSGGTSYGLGQINKTKPKAAPVVVKNLKPKNVKQPTKIKSTIKESSRGKWCVLWMCF